MRVSQSLPSPGIYPLQDGKVDKSRTTEIVQKVEPSRARGKAKYLPAFESPSFQNTTTYDRLRRVKGPHTDEVRGNVKRIQNFYRKWTEQNQGATDLSPERFMDMHPGIKGYVNSFYNGPIEGILHHYL